MAGLEDYCSDLPITAFTAGDIFLAQGELTGRIYVLLDGEVEILRDGFQINLVADRGAVFGEMSVLLGAPHMATVRATTLTHMHVINDGAAFLQSHQEASYFLAQLLAERLSGVTSYLVDLKRQFADRQDHLSMVDDILETLVHEQKREFTPGSDREPD